MIWVPDFWWHETCGMDSYSVGIGGITYEGVSAPSAPCRAPDEYRVDDIPYCKTTKCPSLDDRGLVQIEYTRTSADLSVPRRLPGVLFSLITVITE